MKRAVSVGYGSKSVDVGSDARDTLRSRASGIYMCDAPNFNGHCQWHPLPVGCTSFSPQYDVREISFGPDPTVKCTVYNNAGCSITADGSVSMNIKHPGFSIHGPLHTGSGGIAMIAYHCESTLDRPSLPIDGNTISVDKVVARDTVGVYICNGPNWTGHCKWHQLVDTGGQFCNSLEDAQNSSSISFGPDQGVLCSLHADDTCSGSQVRIMAFPGETSVPGPAYVSANNGLASDDSSQCTSNCGDVPFKYYKCWKDVAAPVPVVRSPDFNALEQSDRRRGILGAYLCTDQDWAGKCKWHPLSGKPCSVIEDSQRSENISFGPDKGLVCGLWINEACTGGVGMKLYHPGSPLVPGPRHKLNNGGDHGYKSYSCKTDDRKRSLPAVNEASIDISKTDNISLPRDTPLGIMITQFPNWQGQWLVSTHTDGSYNKMPFSDQSHISFGPDPGVVCNIYSDPKCLILGPLCTDKDIVAQVRYPGEASLASNLGVAVYRCWIEKGRGTNLTPRDLSQNDDRVAMAVERREDKGIYVCPLPDWAGECSWMPIPKNQCNPLPFPMQPVISVGPDKGVKCIINDGICTDWIGELIVEWPGSPRTKKQVGGKGEG